MTTRIARLHFSAALALTTLAGLAAWAAAPNARASISDAPCDTSHLLVKRELRDTVLGRDALLGKLYVFDEGKNLCAVTTSAGTLWNGTPKLMQVTLSVGGKVETDRRRDYRFYAGRIRLPDTGGCFMAQGIVELKSGDSADVYASCPSWRQKRPRA